jgi:uncharacterized protein
MNHIPRLVLIAMIKLYKLVLSPILPMACRYTPSCSDYGAEALHRYGALRGGRMALMRFLRCNPWGGSGFDPVPDLKKQ